MALAIITKKTISCRERLRIEADLAGRLGRDVDLVVFGQAAPLLQHHFLKHGRLICENDPVGRVRQEVRARAEYMDTRRLFRSHFQPSSELNFAVLKFKHTIKKKKKDTSLRRKISRISLNNTL
ncbi:MAG: hypothetical protein JW943_11565 [Deltaproteobacteria bacterium]|nr:hypothetical protein [Deltaproteobacteria bacterium]